MKNTAKIRKEAESYSVSETAALLGVSIPTLKRMVAESRLEGFRTPGGHLRILAESVEELRTPPRERLRPVRDASPVLQNRRERLEELTLEAQEIRAKRELERLRKDQEKEAERELEEQEAREQEAAEREAEVDLERERLEQRRAEQLRSKQAERERADFRCRWMERAYETFRLPEYAWLSIAQRKEITAAIDGEIDKREATDEPLMMMILGQTIDALVERYQTERHEQEQRQRIIRRAVGSLSAFATEQEKAHATQAARDAVARLEAEADEGELCIAAQAALKPVEATIQKRLRESRVLDWAVRQLPHARTELDAVRVQKECAEILSELPEGTSESAAKEALESTIHEACHDIEERGTKKQRQVRKAQLVERGLAEVSNYLFELRLAGEITPDEYWDDDFSQHLKTAVRRLLQTELSGDESNKEIRELVRETINNEIE